MYVSQLREEDLVYDYLFTSQRESHSVSDMEFLTIPSHVLSYMELCRIELPNLTSSILMEVVTIFICTSPQSLGFVKKVSLS